MNLSKSCSSVYRNVYTFTKFNTNVIQCRFYRFGRSVLKNGYYVSPKWFDQDLLDSILKSSQKKLIGKKGILYRTNKIFDDEKERQKSLIPRIEKIEVELEKPFPKSQDYTLMMNANISTPYDCACHIHQLVKERTALALVNGTEYWDMHKPLINNCRVKLLHFKHEDVMQVNYAFWRSCSMLLASVIKKAFKEQFEVKIISMPMSDLKGGSFLCDVSISNLDDWNPTEEELRGFTSLLWEETSKDHRFERLDVNDEIAKSLFEDNPHRLAYIESKVKSQNTSFAAYRIGNHIELSDQPMIANTAQIGSIHLSAVHYLKTSNGTPFYRFQGIALPKQLHINSFAFSVIRDRSKKLNTFGLQ